MKSKDINAFLGKGNEFDGKLSFQGTVRIDANFKGEISAVEGNLIVGELGMVEADIRISYLIVSGEIRGNINADKKIELHPSGKVFGNITTPILSIQEGAIFEGEVRMSQADDREEKKLILLDSDGPVDENPPPLGTIRGVVLADPTRPDGSIDDIITAREEKKKAEPVQNAKVIAVCKEVGTRKTNTDESGYYELTDLEDGVWKLKLKARGYEIEEAEVKVSGGGTYEINFE